MILAAYLGRRPLLLISHLFMAIFAGIIVPGTVRSVAALVVTAVFLFNCFFNIGAGPLPWASAGEMTPRYAMTAVSAIGTSINYVSTFLIGVIFPPLNNWWKNYTFLFFMGWNIAAFIFVFLFVPETKDRPIEETVRLHSCGIHQVLGSKWSARPLDHEEEVGHVVTAVKSNEDEEQGRVLLGDTASESISPLPIAS
ncbi:Bifunctional purine biosynthesis protein PurH [Coemansia asiatica]|nr:Bifunctional purine biosynthesis protein PurH [Coemansia asiatica]